MRTNTAIRSSVPRRLYTEVLGGKTITNFLRGTAKAD